MKIYKKNPAVVIFILILAMMFPACKKKTENPPVDKSIWDIDKDGIPKFVANNYIELAKIYRISKYRSSVGHDYSDAFEHCRSMKHYFEPIANLDWTTVKVYAPVSGKITRVEPEWAGDKIEIESNEYPAFRFSVFHVNLISILKVGDPVSAGQLLGTHIGTQTLSDISVIVNDPTRQGRMVSYFDVITDGVFNDYFNRGVQTRADLIISKAKRDANPLTCNG
ncbi:MAG: hypothetical protein Q8M15_01005, partial [Bacteroidota bacterium]|nr:hypothetical protein [Bacteroidota bacterium]